MKRAKLRFLITLVFVFILVIGMGGQALAAPPADNPDKGPPNLSKIVFVHYPKGLAAKGGDKGPPKDKPPKDDNGGGGKLWYKYGGIHWATLPASFLYNPTGEPGDYLGAIQLGFDTWTAVDGSNFTFGTGIVTNDYGISGLDNVRDTHNVVGWADLDAYGFTNAIAVTMVWYNTLSGEIIEVDMALNSNDAFAWHQNDDLDEEWDMGNDTPYYDVDVQNIVTHEAGHWLLLGDLYQKPANEQTMFGISAEFDLKKRSLESGDIAGIQEIYPG